MTTPTILARIALTPDEWMEIRKLAIDTGQRPSQLLAEAWRAYLKGRKA